MNSPYVIILYLHLWRNGISIQEVHIAVIVVLVSFLMISENKAVLWLKQCKYNTNKSYDTDTVIMRTEETLTPN